MSLSARRAWIEIIDDLEPSSTRKSLSARRAWIEIPITLDSGALPGVALRKESVDRNLGRMGEAEFSEESLSARRAWIEIQQWTAAAIPVCRSPQGERG